MTSNNTVLFCQCQGERIDPAHSSAVEAHLDTKGVRVIKLKDLCGLVGKKDPRLSGLVQQEGTQLVLGCHHRSMDLLLSQIPSWGETRCQVKHINMITETRDEILQQIDAFCTAEETGVEAGGLNGTPLPTAEEWEEESEWISWYPLIDTGRCTDCGQCADFCLFGVYDKGDDGVRVVHPEGCKNNCPACARICPSTAIVFPKYKYGGAIGGSEEIDEEAEAKRQARDVESILGEGDLYAALEKRKARRRSVIREEAMRKALDERQKALGKPPKN